MIGNVIQARYLQVTDYPTASALSFILMAAILDRRVHLRAGARDRRADRGVDPMATASATRRRAGRAGPIASARGRPLAPADLRARRHGCT